MSNSVHTLHRVGLHVKPTMNRPIWTTVLRPKLDKLPQNRSFRAEDTVVVLSVTQRGDINWNILEKQLEKWSQILFSYTVYAC
ncbi:hypothetical protein QBC46DRAFT_401503 [Diplogelasinospora grovesii]|uniref:Uncharacterized protein n=1 Tax=Diplogelasinospora grovesii TaxID=303347 RepID=A0AAN6RYP8_9PEZI|nr:hypothetical protein QBC46DRAFT_401503 [Diplogelasinospora grovesii]